MKILLRIPAVLFTSLSFFNGALGQNFDKPSDEMARVKAESVIQKAVAKLGGDRYLKVKTTVGEGSYSLLKDGVNVSYQKFIDVIVSPDKERTDFTENGSKTVQVNTGETGWIYEEHLESFRDQSAGGIESFKTSLRSHYDFLLRGNWKDQATLSYEGRRPASLGKRNDVLKLTFHDGFEVEYEFDDDGTPMKTIYTRLDSEKKGISEETRFAKFINEQGIQTPFVIDHYADGVQTFRVNFESVVYNKSIPNEIFTKPGDPKKLRKRLKL